MTWEQQDASMVAAALTASRRREGAVALAIAAGAYEAAVLRLALGVAAAIERAASEVPAAREELIALLTVERA